MTRNSTYRLALALVLTGAVVAGVVADPLGTNAAFSDSERVNVVANAPQGQPSADSTTDATDSETPTETVTATETNSTNETATESNRTNGTTTETNGTNETATETVTPNATATATPSNGSQNETATETENKPSIAGTVGVGQTAGAEEHGGGEPRLSNEVAAAESKNAGGR